MPFSLIWLPEVLTRAGLKVALVDGWETRGIGDVGRTLGVLCHHTVGRRSGNMPSLNVLINGRPGLSGPLSQLGLGRDGTYYIIAAGRAQHAGKGTWMGVSGGNTHFIGIEAENTGGTDDLPWPAVQMDAYHRGVAAILKHAGLGPERCAGHKEFALPAGRKPDPSFDMVAFRTSVAAILNGSTPPPTLIPREEPPKPNAPPGRPTIRRGSTGDAVRALQDALGLPVTGTFDASTEATVRRFQRDRQLVADGIVGPKSWNALDALKKAA
jgi:hypothetical protein